MIWKQDGSAVTIIAPAWGNSLEAQCGKQMYKQKMRKRQTAGKGEDRETNFPLEISQRIGIDPFNTI